MSFIKSKDKANQERHGVSFDEAAELFTSGVDYLEIYDEEHSQDEDRFIAIGPVRRRVILVVYTERHEDVIRIISARESTKAEARIFGQYMGEKS